MKARTLRLALVQQMNKVLRQRGSDTELTTFDVPLYWTQADLRRSLAQWLRLERVRYR